MKYIETYDLFFYLDDSYDLSLEWHPALQINDLKIDFVLTQLHQLNK